MDNYRNHLEHELAQANTRLASVDRHARREEAAWMRVKEMVAIVDQIGPILSEMETEQKERFRTSHIRLSECRTEIGELEGELFQNDEEREAWYGHQ